ncbi:MAG: hypothetical protein WCQ00_03840 [bacterium]
MNKRRSVSKGNFAAALQVVTAVIFLMVCAFYLDGVRRALHDPRYVELERLASKAQTASNNYVLCLHTYAEDAGTVCRDDIKAKELQAFSELSEVAMATPEDFVPAKVFRLLHDGPICSRAVRKTADSGGNTKVR